MGVIRDEDNLVVGVLTDTGEHAVKNKHFAGPPGLNVAVAAATGVFGDKFFGEVGFAAFDFVREVEEVWMITQFLELSNSLERF